MLSLTKYYFPNTSITRKAYRKKSCKRKSSKTVDKHREIFYAYKHKHILTRHIL